MRANVHTDGDQQPNDNNDNDNGDRSEEGRRGKRKIRVEGQQRAFRLRKGQRTKESSAMPPK